MLAEPPSKYSVDVDLANELNKLDFKDRVKLEEEIHGVTCAAVTETPELLKQALADFDSKVNALKEGVKPKPMLRNVIRISSLGEAEAEAAKSKCYLNDPDIRLRFLRAENFDVEKAVERMNNFLEFSSEVFGDYVADRPFAITDFDSKEETLLANSRTQYLPFRDRSGRRVCVSVGACNFDYDTDLRFKILMYLHWVVSEDVETQRKGVVFVSWIFDEDEERSWQHALRPKFKSAFKPYYVMHWKSIPIRVLSYHHYYVEDTLFFRSIWALYVFHLKDAERRKAFKSFFGDSTELLYKLSGFGVPTDLLPISCTGKVKTANHSAFLNVQRAKLKRRNDEEEIVECPRSEDVVFKKGPGYRNNPGNVYFRSLIEKYGEEHHVADKEEKYQITLRVLEAVEKINGRFLEWNKKRKLWLASKDRNKIRTKVASSIKQYNRQRRQQEEQLQSSIANAASIESSFGNVSDSGDSSDPNNNTKRGLSKEYSLYYEGTKRRKLVNLCETSSGEFCLSPNTDLFGSHTAGSAEDQFCFGRSFFPTSNDLNQLTTSKTNPL